MSSLRADADEQQILLDDLMERIKLRLDDSFDMVVAVERGGILPGYLAARYLDISFKTVAIHFRDDLHRPLYEEPQLVGEPGFSTRGKRVLLVDDVSNSGATLRKAASALEGADITTMVISGNGDISLYGPHERCIRWPWQ